MPVFGPQGLIGRGFGGGGGPADPILSMPGVVGVFRYDDNAYLFQDEAGATPVTATGQTIKRVANRVSGGADVNWPNTNSTLDDISGNKHQSLSTAATDHTSSGTFSVSNQFYMCGCVGNINGTSIVYLFGMYNNSSNAAYFWTMSSGLRCQVRLSGTSSVPNIAGGGPASSAPFVFDAYMNGTAIDVWSSANGGTASSTHANTLGTNLNGAYPRIGYSSAGNGFDLYGMLFVTGVTVSTEDRATFRQYIADRAGITLP